MKKILIISNTFYPENTPRAFRTTELAKEFSKQGHQVKVLTFKKDEHSVFEKKYNVTIEDLGKKNWKTLSLKGSGVVLLYRRLIHRLSNLLLEYPNIKLIDIVYKALQKERQNYDLLISIAVPHPIHWGVAKFYDKNQKISKLWVADCGDPYMGCQTDSFKKPFYFKYLEKKFCRLADYITVPFKGAIQAYYSEFHHKIKVIPQGFNFFDKSDFDGKKLSEKDGIIRFIYAGSFIPKFRDPGLFMELLSEIKKDFIFTVFTNNDSLLEPYKENLGSKLVVKNYVTRVRLFEEMLKVDFLVNFDNNVTGQLPSKLIDYGMTGKPILNITKTTNLNDVKRFFNEDFENALEIDNLDNYRIENVVKQFLSLEKN